MNKKLTLRTIVKHTITVQNILLLTLSYIILACTEQKSSNADHIIYFDTKENVDKYDMKDLTDGTFSIIPLETTDDCLISKIDKIEIKNDRIYIMDRLAQSVYVFDMGGKYLNKICNRGQGPGEYTNLSYMTVTDSSVIVIDHLAEKHLEYSIPSLNYIRGKRLFDKIWTTELFYLDGTIYYMNNWSNSAAGKFRLFSMKHNTDNYEKYLPFEEEPMSLGISGPKYAISGHEASVIYSGDNNIYRIRDGKVFPEYEVKFKDKKVEYSSGKVENIFNDNPPGRVIGINSINESDKYLFIDIAMTSKDNTPIGPGNYDKYTCFHNKSDHSTVIYPHIMYNSIFYDGHIRCPIKKIINNKIIYWIDANLLLAVYTKEELSKTVFNHEAYGERLKHVLANLTEEDNPVLYIFGLK
ncbi:MAG: 6-bladed beta-propeller [Bacteroidales bacterium]|jgi:hypothetical protein|nr:6-bladed beta-propeller [Bacteroidales bacterium]